MGCGDLPVTIPLSYICGHSEKIQCSPGITHLLSGKCGTIRDDIIIEDSIIECLFCPLIENILELIHSIRWEYHLLLSESALDLRTKEFRELRIVGDTYDRNPGLFKDLIDRGEIIEYVISVLLE